jgi:hypothetical protein|tara:strand:+ start:1372 stop:1965 length:594 start_codon:yes stop_codon:yes gene_type:complete
MKKRIVKYYRENKENGKIEGVMVEFAAEEDSVYDAVENFKKRIQSGCAKKIVLWEELLIRDVINLHNVEGIKDLGQIKRMVESINQGKDLVSEGVANVKIAKSDRNEYVLFDGHHTLLAYMLAGKEKIKEVPYLTVENEGKLLDDSEFLVFFGSNASRIKGNWRQFVINWQAEPAEQLGVRKQKNMGELFQAVKLKL